MRREGQRNAFHPRFFIQPLYRLLILPRLFEPSVALRGFVVESRVMEAILSDDKDTRPQTAGEGWGEQGCTCMVEYDGDDGENGANEHTDPTGLSLG